MNAEMAEPAARHRPSRGWYVLALLVVLVTGGVFAAAVMRERGRAWSSIEAMPRFVAPTGEGGVEIELAEAGEYVLFYENLGSFEGQSFNTPRQQVWTTPTQPAMACRVTSAGRGAGEGEVVPVRLLGQTGDKPGEFDADRDTAVIYERRAQGEAQRQGVGVWTFTIDEPGRYTVTADYLSAVHLDPATVEVPPELTRDEQSQMRFEDVERYEQERAEQINRLALASLEAKDVLFAVGQDPTAGSYFNVAGLKGAATLLAFGLTAGAIIALVTLMLRTGSVTERGTIENVRRGVGTR